MVHIKHLQYGLEDDDRILYIHTKGVTRYNTSIFTVENCDIDIPNLYKNICQRRDLMEFFLIKKYEVCLKILDDYNVDTVGINICDSPLHYSGNFWWTTGRYLHSLRYDEPKTENWILGKYGTYISLFQSPFVGGKHYYNDFPLSMVSDISFDNMFLFTF